MTKTPTKRETFSYSLLLERLAEAISSGATDEEIESILEKHHK